MSKRKNIGKRARFEIFKRDKFTCQYCGAQPPSVVLHVDHIVAVANGGTNDAENLVTACENCNLGKSAVPLSSVPRSLEETAEEETERTEQLKAHAEQIRQARLAVEDAVWEIAEIIHPGASDGWPRDKFNGVKMFIERLGYARTMEAAHITLDSSCPQARLFKYFCAVCWNKIREDEKDV